MIVGTAHRRRRYIVPSTVTDAANLASWHDASDASTQFTDTGRTTLASVNDLVAAWADKSAFGNHITQATPQARPMAVLNGAYRELAFDAGDYLTRATFTQGNLGTSTIYVVATSNVASPGNHECVVASVAPYFRHYHIGAGYNFYNGEVLTGGGSVNHTVPRIVRLRYVPGVQQYYITDMSAPVGTAGTKAAPVFNGLVVGAALAADVVQYALNGRIRELRAYAADHSNALAATVKAELASKWGTI